VSELLHQLEERRNLLLRHLSLVEMLIAVERGQNIPITDESPVSSSPIVHRSKRGISPESLAGQILSSMNTSPRDSWSSSKVYEVIKASDPIHGAYVLPEDDLKARNAVSATMGQLWRSGRLQQMSPSKGAVPASYRLISEEEIL
jgi:hypothetical protein